jgi:zinc transport system substrate-binding protein
MKQPFISFLAVCFLLFGSCGQEKPRIGALLVFVSIAPQKYFIEKIGGPFIAVSVMVEPGVSPHAYEPRPSQMTALSKARAYFSIGLEFEKPWLPRFQSMSSGMMVIQMDSGVAKQPVNACDESLKGSATKSDGHHHEGLDPHIWLSPELVKKQVETACHALCRLDPAHESVYQSNCRAFEAEINALQDTIEGILRPITSASAPKTFMVFHPSWGYFASEFHLRQLAVEIEGKEPSARQLQIIIETAKRENTHTIFVQPQFSKRSAEIISRQIGGNVEIADDLAYDWRNNLISFAKTLASQ